MTHFGGAAYQKKMFFGRMWCSTWQWSDVPVHLFKNISPLMSGTHNNLVQLMNVHHLSTFSTMKWVLTLNFLRGVVWAFEMTLMANSSKRNVPGRSQHVSLCFSWIICCQWWWSCFNMKSWLFTTKVWSQEWINYYIWWYIPIYRQLTLFWMKTSNFLWTLSLISKRISILNVILKVWTIHFLHIFITFSWSLMIPNWL